MSAETRPGGDTKVTKLTKITKSLFAFVVFVTFVVFVPRPSGVSGQAPQSSQRPPVFRAGANYVRVDAYPTLDGRIIQGLTKDDFEIFEDGKPQTVAASELVTLDVPDDARGSILSAREGLELAGDPRYRVVLLVIDRAAFDLTLWRTMREDLHDFLETLVGPRDLVGLVTTDRGWTDLVIGKSIQAIKAELDAPEWLHAQPQEQTAVLRGCELDGLRGRIRAEETYGLLEGLIQLLGQVREDRTSLVFVSNGLSRATPDRRWEQKRKVGLPPKMGLVNGRIQRIPSASSMHDRFCASEGQRLADIDFARRFDDLVSSARASNVAFYPVAVPVMIPLMPGGRGGFGPVPGTTGMPVPMRLSDRLPDTLVELAGDTSGYLIAGRGDVRRGLQRVVADAGPHYLLGYYTTNNKRDGKVRYIKVRLKKNGAEIPARRFYRGPAKKDLTGTTSAPDGPVGAPAPVAAALGALSRLRSSTQFFTYGAVAGQTLTVVVEVPAVAVQAGRWKDGAALEVLAETSTGEVVGTSRGRLTPNGRAVLRVPFEGQAPPASVFVRLRAEGESVVERTAVAPGPSSLIGDPLAYRSGPRGLANPVGLFEFVREERVRLDWLVLTTIDRFEARMLDRNGQPLRHRVSVTPQDAADGRHLVANLSLTSLGRGDYVVELTAEAGGVTERKLLAFRVK